jgi:hypothetical protein
MTDYLVPQDIDPDFFAKSAPIGVESPKVDKPSNPEVDKSVSEPKRCTQLCWSYGHGPPGGPQPSEGSSVPQSRKQPL